VAGSSSVTADPHGPAPRPKLRGLFHLYAFFVSLVVGAVLVTYARTGREQLAAGIFAAAVAVMFGASALHHRVTWTLRGYRWSRRVDHAGVYLAIAGTYTPFCLLVLGGAWRIAVLAVVWSGAAIALGWVAVVAFPQLLDGIGWDGMTLILIGGLLYTLGGLAYALRRPNPLPGVFGYHEVFHLFVVLAVALQYSVVAFWVVAP
jgi:hemolysin III